MLLLLQSSERTLRQELNVCAPGIGTFAYDLRAPYRRPIGVGQYSPHIEGNNGE